MDIKVHLGEPPPRTGPNLLAVVWLVCNLAGHPHGWACMLCSCVFQYLLSNIFLSQGMLLCGVRCVCHLR
jgi:hypothetical protein